MMSGVRYLGIKSKVSDAADSEVYYEIYTFNI